MKENSHYTDRWGQRQTILHILTLAPQEGLPKELFWQCLPDRLQAVARKMVQENVLVDYGDRIYKNPLIPALQAPPLREALLQLGDKLFLLLYYVVSGQAEEILPEEADPLPEDVRQQRTRAYHEKTGGALAVLAENILRLDAIRSNCVETFAANLATYAEICGLYELAVRCTVVELTREEARNAELSELTTSHLHLLRRATAAYGGKTHTLTDYFSLYQKMREAYQNGSGHKN